MSDDVEAIYELSPLQQGMLVDGLLSDGAGLYVEQLVLEVGELAPSEWAHAWQDLVAAHPVLRTSIHWRDLEQPLQVVHRRATVPMAYADMADLAPERRRAAIGAFLARDRARSLALDAAPLLRLAVIRTGRTAHLAVVTVHHILIDGWSLGILMDEVALLYRSRVGGTPCRLAERRPFADYIAWLRARDQDEDEGFWRDALGGFQGAPPVGAVGGGRHDRLRRFAHGERRLTVPPALAGRVSALARGLRVTVNTVVLGAWSLALARELGTDDLVVGTVVSGRDAAMDGIGDMVGLFINTVPVRVRLQGGLPARLHLQALQRTQLEVRAHQHCALSAIQGWSGVPRGRPLFESIFVFENHVTPDGSAEAAGRASAFERTGYPLTVLVGLVGGMTVRVLHDRAAVADEVVDRLTERLLRVLAQLADAPDAPLRAVDGMAADERAAVLAAGRGAPVRVPGDDAVTGFGGRLARFGSRPAIVEPDGPVTFAEVARRAGVVAGALRAGGAGPGIVVGVCAERGAWAAAGLLGVLEVGAAFLAMDPRLPAQRLAELAARAGAAVVVTTAGCAGLLPPDVPAVVVDEPGPQVAGAALRATPRAELAGVAYVLFTSGSTGAPKGVLGTRRGLLSRLAWGWAADPYAEDERCALKTRASFVDFVPELLGPLLAGVPAVVVDDATVADVGALARALRREGVTRLVAVPSLLSALFEQQAPVLAGSRLRHVTSSGEPLRAELLRRISAVLPGCRVVNLYGSTEVGPDATWHVADGSEPDPVPIGRPVGGMAVHVLGPGGELLPAGVVGELHVGGAGVAAGYLGQPELTAARFVPDHLAGEGTLFRTGDLGRRRADGLLECLGRADRQVKVRGVRVEPAEVEAVLVSHPAVQDAAVLARTHPTRGTELVAHLVLSDAATPLDIVRAHLRARLPEQAVPARLVPIAAIPTGPTGKADHAALQRLLAEAADGDGLPSVAYEPPEGATEAAIAELWAALTGARRVGRHDDFFQLGGHSLLATRAVSALSTRFGADLPLTTLFEHPTAAGLAAVIEAARVPAGDVPQAGGPAHG